MIDIHADDYALSVNTSVDILKIMKEGCINSVSILPNMACFEKSCEMWREVNPVGVKISIHINLVEGHCLAPIEKVPLLINNMGYLNLSWKHLLLFNYATKKKRNEFKNQLKVEINEQIKRVVSAYHLIGGLRIDGHQHTQMISVVLEAIQEVILEEGYNVEYIRDSHDLILPYLRRVALLPTYRPINTIKVLLLNHFSRKNRKVFITFFDKGMYISGVFLSGKMDYDRLQQICPKVLEKCEKSGKKFEVLFHPGTLLNSECGEEFINPDAVKFYISDNRKLEFETMEKIAKEQLRLGDQGRNKGASDKIKFIEIGNPFRIFFVIFLPLIALTYLGCVRQISISSSK